MEQQILELKEILTVRRDREFRRFLLIDKENDPKLTYLTIGKLFELDYFIKTIIDLQDRISQDNRELK
jgi:hypothetical protein